MSGAQDDDFVDFVRRTSPDLLRYFLARVHPADSAADCLGEVLLVVWRRRSALPDAHDERRAWAFGIAHKVLSTHYRTTARRSKLTDRLRAELMTMRIPNTPEVASAQLAEALQKLGTADRDLLLLVAWEGFTVAEAGRIIGIRAAAARARYSRLRGRLRVSLAD